MILHVQLNKTLPAASDEETPDDENDSNDDSPDTLKVDFSSVTVRIKPPFGTSPPTIGCLSRASIEGGPATIEWGSTAPGAVGSEAASKPV